jgi:hypothetical protein
MTDRGPGILTKEQRKFVRMSEPERKESFNRQERYKYRKRIQKRLENAMVDFRLLHEFDEDFSTSEVEDAFAPTEGERADDPDIMASAYVPTAVRFFARGLDSDNETLYDLNQLGAIYDPLLSAVERAIERDVADRKDTLVSLDLAVDVSGPETRVRALDQLAEDDLPAREKLRLVSLLQQAGVDDDRLAEAAPDVVPSESSDSESSDS